MYEKPHECNWKARLELAVEGFEQQTTTWGESLKLILSGGIHLLISLIGSHLLATCHKLVVGSVLCTSRGQTHLDPDLKQLRV